MGDMAFSTIMMVAWLTPACERESEGNPSFKTVDANGGILPVNILNNVAPNA